MTQAGDRAHSRLRGGLFSRFAASTALLAAAVVVLSSGFFVLTHEDFFEHSLETTLRGVSLSLAEVIWREPEKAGKIAERHRLGVTVRGPNGETAFLPDGRQVEAAGQVEPGHRYRRIDISGPDGRSISFYWDLVIFARAHVPMVVVLTLLLLVMIGATYAFQVNQLRPLRWLRGGVEAVSRGDFTVRVPVVRTDEIGQVASAFNQMTRRVERMMEDRERLLTGVSHELRSPLARMRVALELLPPGSKNDSLRRDVQQMETLISALLERGRLEAQSDRLERSEADLIALVREVLTGAEDRAPGLRLEAPPGTIQLNADPDLLRILVHNLVDNALKFSPAEGPPVTVTLEGESEKARITISDHGPGIPEAERERVFEPFVKLDPARGHRSGYGLGLDLCRRIVLAHGGSLKISGYEAEGPGDAGSAATRGTVVVVTLPRQPAA